MASRLGLLTLTQGAIVGFIAAKMAEAAGWHVNIGGISMHHYIFLLIALAILVGLYPVLKQYSVYPFLLGFCVGGIAEEWILFDWLLVALMVLLIVTISFFAWLPPLFREVLIVKLATAIIACIATSIILVQVDFGPLESVKGVIIGTTNAMLSAGIWYVARRQVYD
jgi:hypothetical protein